MKYLPLIIMFVFNCNIHAQGCSNDPYYSCLDFWIGKWDVYSINGVKAGTNTIAKELNGCAVTELWTSAFGSKGKSLFYVDNTSKKWKQVWVTENAKLPWGQKEKALIRLVQDSILIFQGTYYLNEVKNWDRTTLSRVDENEVMQIIESSSDSISWNQTFKGIYKRKLN